MLNQSVSLKIAELAHNGKSYIELSDHLVWIETESETFQILYEDGLMTIDIQSDFTKTQEYWISDLQWETMRDFLKSFLQQKFVYLADNNDCDNDKDWEYRALLGYEPIEESEIDYTIDWNDES